MTTPKRFDFLSVVVILYLVLTLFCTYQAHITTDYSPGKLTNYNNYIIFQQSFYHLIEHKDLYVAYENEYWDLYKYSPTFALIMAPIAVLPSILGLAVWNLLNVVLVLIGIRKLRFFNNKQKGWILLFCLVEMVTSLQNEQSNGLIAGLIILCFALVEEKKFLFATLCIALSCYVKILGLAAFSIFLLYPEKIKSAAYSVFWTIVLFLLPLFVISWAELIAQYQSWGNMLSNDHSTDGLSIMKVLESWFGIVADNTLVQVLGVVFFCIPLLRYRNFSHERFRLLLLSSILIWIVVFNHKAESPTFIIAVLGVALWFFVSQKKWWHYVLFFATLTLAQLSATDIFPRSLRDGFFQSHAIKALPCIAVWFCVVGEMIFFKSQPSFLKKSLG